MPSTDKSRRHAAAFAELLWEELRRRIEKSLSGAIKTEGFTQTLRNLELLEKGRVPASGMMTVYEGVLEGKPSGYADGAFQTNFGPVVMIDGQLVHHDLSDVQLIPSIDNTENAASGEAVLPEELVDRLASCESDALAGLICEIELTRFNELDRQRLLPLLWEYILRHRDSNRPDTLAAVGAAIRKYVALMPMEEMGQLAILLESGHKSALPIELEIEVAKMIYRNFEVHPPLEPNSYPELARSLWEMVHAYANPRLLLRDKHSAAALIAIQALVAMRSEFASNAVQLASTNPYRWFAEVVADHLDRLHERWDETNPDAAAWLTTLQKVAQVTA